MNLEQARKNVLLAEAVLADTENYLSKVQVHLHQLEEEKATQEAKVRVARNRFARVALSSIHEETHNAD